jgi:hypothetical protein
MLKPENHEQAVLTKFFQLKSDDDIKRDVRKMETELLAGIRTANLQRIDLKELVMTRATCLTGM